MTGKELLKEMFVLLNSRLTLQRKEKPSPEASLDEQIAWTFHLKAGPFYSFYSKEGQYGLLAIKNEEYTKEASDRAVAKYKPLMEATTGRADLYEVIQNFTTELGGKKKPVYYNQSVEDVLKDFFK